MDPPLTRLSGLFRERPARWGGWGLERRGAGTADPVSPLETQFAGARGRFKRARSFEMRFSVQKGGGYEVARVVERRGRLWAIRSTSGTVFFQDREDAQQFEKDFRAHCALCENCDLLLDRAEEKSLSEGTGYCGILNVSVPVTGCVTCVSFARISRGLRKMRRREVRQYFQDQKGKGEALCHQEK